MVYVVLRYELDWFSESPRHPLGARVCGVFSSEKLANEQIALCDDHWLINGGSAEYEVSVWIMDA